MIYKSWVEFQHYAPHRVFNMQNIMLSIYYLRAQHSAILTHFVLIKAKQKLIKTSCMFAQNMTLFEIEYSKIKRYVMSITFKMIWIVVFMNMIDCCNLFFALHFTQNDIFYIVTISSKIYHFVWNAEQKVNDIIQLFTIKTKIPIFLHVIDRTYLLF